MSKACHGPEHRVDACDHFRMDLCDKREALKTVSKNVQM